MRKAVLFTPSSAFDIKTEILRECKTEIKSILPYTMIFAIGPCKVDVPWKVNQFCEKCRWRFFVVSGALSSGTFKTA